MSGRKKSVSRQKSGGRQKPTASTSDLRKKRMTKRTVKEQRQDIVRSAIQRSITDQVTVGWTPADEYQFMKDRSGNLIPIVLKDHCDLLTTRLKNGLLTDSGVSGKGITVSVSTVDDVTDMRSTTIYVDYLIPDPNLLERETLARLDHGTMNIITKQMVAYKSKGKVYDNKDGSKTYSLFIQVENIWGKNLNPTLEDDDE